MVSRITLKEKAKEDLKGNVFIAFVAIIIPSLISSLPLYFINAKNSSSHSAMIGIIEFLIYVFMLPMYTGLRLFFLNLSYRRAPNLNNLITPYQKKSHWEIIKANLLRALYVLIGTILFVIPGIYLLLKYLMINYILADNPTLKYDEAMRMSAKIMINNKWKAIEIALSFILWLFAIAFTLGIALIYVAPYFEATFANFYNEIKIKDEPVIEEKDIFNDI